MVIRVLFLFLSLIVLVNLCIITLCYITGENLYKKYGKQMLIIFGQKVFWYANSCIVPACMFPCDVQSVCNGWSGGKRN